MKIPPPDTNSMHTLSHSHAFPDAKLAIKANHHRYGKLLVTESEKDSVGKRLTNKGDDSRYKLLVYAHRPIESDFLVL